jgi:hypothetical protein
MMNLALGVNLPAVAYASVGLTPPSLAPVLTAYVGFGQTDIDLDWTASNKTTSSGFSYSLFRGFDGISFSPIATVYDLFFTDTNLGDGTIYYKVIPVNDAGEGPSSNIVSATVPGT